MEIPEYEYDSTLDTDRRTEFLDLTDDEAQELIDAMVPAGYPQYREAVVNNA